MSDKGRWAGLVELAAAVVISVAAALTSWGGFQAALWDGEQAAHYAQAGAVRVQATRAASAGGMWELADLLAFHQWLDAYAENDERRATFYRTRFRPEFEPAFEAWLALKPLLNPAAPPTPFEMKQYRSTKLAESKALQVQADALFERGQHDNDVSDRFVRSTVLLAVALFFGGISQTFQSTRIKAALVAIAAVICLVTVLQMLRLPTLQLQGF